MNPRNRTIAVVAAVGVALAATVVWGAHAAATRHRGGFVFQRIVQRLALTPDQVQQIKEVLRHHQGELETQVTAVVDARRRLFDAIHAASSSEAAIRAAASAAGSAESDLAVTRGTIAQEVRAVLTPEQQATAEQMLHDFEARVLDRVEVLRSRLQAFLG